MNHDTATVTTSSILLVDDDPRNSKLLKTRLTNEGYIVNVASDGREALPLLQIERFDLVLLDLNMPNMNGYEVLEWLQNRPQLEHAVIVLTGNGDRDAVTTCLTLGARDYILKTAGTLELLQRVQRACDTARTELRHHQTISDDNWQNARVLVVDDDSMNRRLLRRRLEHIGLQVAELDNGADVINLLENEAFDLVLLDHHMPQVTGLEVLDGIRQSRDNSNIGVVMVTAETDKQQVEQFYTAGADDYLAKPFHAAELQMRLQAVLKNLFLQRQANQT